MTTLNLGRMLHGQEPDQRCATGTFCCAGFDGENLWNKTLEPPSSPWWGFRFTAAMSIRQRF